MSKSGATAAKAGADIQERVAITGNEAVAKAMKQINPDVVAAYPITPQTDIVQYFSQFVADGDVKTEFVTVESEHSAMSAVVGASAGGARAMTATSANGLALMWEIVYIAASMRLPIVMPVVNRALSGPINIHCDHSDSMGARDSGWIQLYSENAQEAYDNTIQAIRIAEHPEVNLPVMVMSDGFIISHAVDNLYVLKDEIVQDFIGEYHPVQHLLDAGNPITIGPLDLFDYYFEHKRQQVEGMERARQVILDIGEEYGKLTGRKYKYFETYKLDDAEIALAVLSSTAGTARVVIDQLRKKGVKVGLLKPRVFRPFPYSEIAEALRGIDVVGVMDRSASFGGIGGPVFTEIRAALYGLDKQPLMKDFIYGLGGRDTGLREVTEVISNLQDIQSSGKVDNLVSYLGVRD